MKPYSGVSDQSKAAVHRRDDAQALFESERWRGAMYLAGYALECFLKSALMRRFGVRTLDELEQVLKDKGLIRADATIFDHRIELYIRAADGLDRLRDDRTAWRRYVIANGWTSSWRYNPDLSSSDDASDFLQAVDAMLAWVGANV